MNIVSAIAVSTAMKQSFFVLAIELASPLSITSLCGTQAIGIPLWLIRPWLTQTRSGQSAAVTDIAPRLDVYSVVPVLRAQLDIVALRDLRQIDPFILLSVYRDHRNCPAARAHRKAVRNQPCYHHGCQNDYPFFRFSVHKHIVVYAAAVVNRQSNVLYCDIIGIGMSI